MIDSALRPFTPALGHELRELTAFVWRPIGLIVVFAHFGLFTNSERVIMAEHEPALEAITLKHVQADRRCPNVNGAAIRERQTHVALGQFLDNHSRILA